MSKLFRLVLTNDAELKPIIVSLIYTDIYIKKALTFVATTGSKLKPHLTAWKTREYLRSLDISIG